MHQTPLIADLHRGRLVQWSPKSAPRRGQDKGLLLWLQKWKGWTMALRTSSSICCRCRRRRRVVEDDEGVVTGWQTSGHLHSTRVATGNCCIVCCCCCCFGGVAADVLAVVGDRGDAVGACDDVGIVCRRPRGLRRVVGGEKVRKSGSPICSYDVKV